MKVTVKKSVKKVKPARPDILAGILPPGIRFLTGALFIIPFLMVNNFFIKISMVLVFIILVFLSGKKLKYLYFMMMIFSITLFNLLTPWGEVLWEIGPLTITRGALEKGLLKGLTITGLVFISLFSVHRDLKLPGPLGSILGRTFFYFERIFEVSKKITRKNFIGDLDRILMNVFPLQGSSLQESDTDDSRTL